MKRADGGPVTGPSSRARERRRRAGDRGDPFVGRSRGHRCRDGRVRRRAGGGRVRPDADAAGARRRRALAYPVARRFAVLPRHRGAVRPGGARSPRGCRCRAHRPDGACELGGGHRAQRLGGPPGDGRFPGLLRAARRCAQGPDDRRRAWRPGSSAAPCRTPVVEGGAVARLARPAGRRSYAGLGPVGPRRWLASALPAVCAQRRLASIRRQVRRLRNEPARVKLPSDTNVRGRRRAEVASTAPDPAVRDRGLSARSTWLIRFAASRRRSRSPCARAAWPRVAPGSLTAEGTAAEGHWHRCRWSVRGPMA